MDVFCLQPDQAVMQMQVISDPTIQGPGEIEIE